MSGSTNPAVPSPSVLLAARIRAVGAVGFTPPCCSPLGGTSEGRMRTKIVLETPEHPRVVRSPAFELALSVGRSGRESGRPPTQILSTTSVVNGTVSYLNGCLPRAERAAARSGSGGGLALDCLSLEETLGRREGARNSERPVCFWCG